MKLLPTNPMNGPLAAVLIFEIIVFWLALPGILQVEQRDLRLSVISILLATAVALAALAGLRRGWGYPLGWLAQALTLALGLLTWWMFALGVVFVGIWVMSVVLGRRLETNSDKQGKAVP